MQVIRNDYLHRLSKKSFYRKKKIETWYFTNFINKKIYKSKAVIIKKTALFLAFSENEPCRTIVLSAFIFVSRKRAIRTRFGIANFLYNCVKSLRNIRIFPAFLPYSMQKFADSEILQTWNRLKLRFFKAKAFGNTRYTDKRQRRKSWF